MTQSRLLDRSRRAVWHPCTQMKSHEALPLVPITRGEGVWLYDDTGRRFLDGVSAWWVNLFGHCNPRINDAICEQLETLEHVMLAGFTHAPVVELSERLSALTGHQLGHAFYASDGASATEIALKMSMHAWRNQGETGKDRFISLAGSYHGETVGALAVTDVALFRDAYAPLVRAGTVVPSPDARHAEPGETDADVAERAALALEHYLAEHHDEIAALIVEPLVQGAVGMAMYHPHYLRRARELCDTYRVHLIADEIAVGCGRTGSFFACEQAGIWPDMMCLSKGISGGYLPLSLVLSTDAIYDCFYDDDVHRGFLHSHSYTGNPLACRAALATLDIFKADDVIHTNKARAELLGDATREAFAEHPAVRHLRQRGMIVAFDVDTVEREFSQRFFAAGLDQGVLLRPIGNTVYFMPPYIVEADDIAHLVGGAAAALKHCIG
ncbi:adenosylmethionine--8-amino-7-oxononanoate transaminase [Denitromonas ohlonensis]|uniref:Adenosylmethionine-8-amino-7-oxononanoate aminotransferase n=2 Tax=Denitromonas TaxID=139331 RepID=A0A558CI97_9RHOO|nr:adenosylmethionine--8-amino-7-oxononanoate transaminase [Denitromonas ohlonensis]TVO69429.1 adenosylmethionine--8-amino-7-oxononanoate transaminase [Denitromonas ohlonensis]TVO77529.1 adenosylmethionine--8-amino-7-oxononanoate transaminase [Denitromonas ohlonensis]TVT48495.1 MAG: adenosylmethionine--8-amino-7-oxononanoate transaminase [Denitromonas halophila]TVT73076.1 MAG: adenosylmethionine--8-amino-7-oxononanoate transaminase [Denitromonas halophila]